MRTGLKRESGLDDAVARGCYRMRALRNAGVKAAQFGTRKMGPAISVRVRSEEPVMHNRHYSGGMCSSDGFGMRAAGGKVPEVKRVLELNMNHPVIVKIKDLFENNKEDATLKDYAGLLLDMAIISEGGKLTNPSRFSKMVGDLMASALSEATDRSAEKK